MLVVMAVVAKCWSWSSSLVVRMVGPSSSPLEEKGCGHAPSSLVAVGGEHVLGGNIADGPGVVVRCCCRCWRWLPSMLEVGWTSSMALIVRVSVCSPVMAVVVVDAACSLHSWDLPRWCSKRLM